MSSANDSLYGNPMANGSRVDPYQHYRDLMKIKVSENKMYASIMGEQEKFYQLKSKLMRSQEMEDLQYRLQTAERGSQEEFEIRKQIYDLEQAYEQRAIDATLAYRNNAYKTASIHQKSEMLKANADNLAAARKAANEEFEQRKALAFDDAEAQKQIREEQRVYNRDMERQERQLRQQAINAEASDAMKRFHGVKDSMENLRENKDFSSAVGLIVDLSSVNTNDLKAIQDATRKNIDAQKAETERRQELLDEAEAKGEDTSEAKAAVVESKLAENMATMQNAIVGAVAELRDSLMGSFKEVEKDMSDYMGPINARLQGSGKTYSGFLGTGGISGVVSSVLSTSPFVKTQDMLENVKKAAESGIVYNIEQRAFLETISDKIATTFDAFDSNLMRLVRLQQADSTAARMGMEASLTKMFNSMFNDTSYLSDMYDTVSAAIIDANSVMTHEAASEFEYVVQKWLGALSSLGLSGETVQQIATGINYLATGDVQNLANNTQLQTLMAMSASYAGISYSDMLVEGLDASTTNKLLESMVTYLKDIAENSDNQVVRSAYGDVFNLSMSDMRAISNITASEISKLSSQNLSYGGMNAELASQMLEVAVNRTTLTEMMSNLYNNAVYGVAQDLVSNPVTYSMVKFLDFMEERNLDMNIPFVNAMGFGLDLNTSVQDLLNLGIGLSSAFSLMTNMLSGLGSAGGLNLDVWGGTTYNSRGGNMSFTTSSLNGGVSGSTFISNQSSADMEKSAISTGTEDAEEKAEITNKNNKSEYTFDDFYRSVILGSDGNNWLRVEEKVLREVYNNTGTNFLHVRDSRMGFLVDSLKVVDTKQSYDGESLEVLDTKQKYDADSLKVLDTQQKYDGDYLLVHDSAFQSTFEKVFGNSSLISSSTVNVADSTLLQKISQTFTSGYIKDNVTSALDSYSTKSGILNVSDSGLSSVSSSLSGLSTALKPKSEVTMIPKDTYTTNKALNVHIVSVAEGAKLATNTVNLAAGTTLTIDEDTLVRAFRKALNEKETGKTSPYTLQEMVKAFIDGTARVKVSNDSQGDPVETSLQSISSSAERILENIMD